MNEDSQFEGIEEDFQRWMKEVREYEMYLTDEPPRIFLEGEDKVSKMRAILDWFERVTS